MTNGKQTKRQLHIATQSGRALCGVFGAATTPDRHTTTCGRCRKIAKLSKAIIEETQPVPPPDPEPIHEPADALELVARLRAKFEQQKQENGHRKAKLAIVPEVQPKKWNEKVTTPAPAADKKGKPMPLCACDCGGYTKGGRFQPGHDARYYAKLKKEALARGEDPRLVQHG